MSATTAALCFALVSYREARSEPIAAQIATMQVLRNRATLNREKPCKELARHRQFAWTSKYKITHPKTIGEKDKNAWLLSMQLSQSLNKVSVKGIKSNYVYFNTLKLGKRYKTKTTPIKLGELLFY
jgi:hypothetical protein